MLWWQTSSNLRERGQFIFSLGDVGNAGGVQNCPGYQGRAQAPSPAPRTSGMAAHNPHGGIAAAPRHPGSIFPTHAPRWKPPIPGFQGRGQNGPVAGPAFQLVLCASHCPLSQCSANSICSEPLLTMPQLPLSMLVQCHARCSRAVLLIGVASCAKVACMVIFH